MALRRKLAVAANNMANANSAGFKSEHARFEEYLHGQGTGRDKVSFVIDKASYMDTRQGGLTQTSNPLDIALQGEGWLGYEGEGGQTVFGRDGRMSINAQGDLVTVDGSPVLSAGGAPIGIPMDAGTISISSDGVISDQGGNQIATIGVFSVDDIQGYDRLGNGKFAAPEELGQPPLVAEPNTRVAQGFVEQSNVEPITEMTKLMEVQRAYQRSSKLAENVDDLRKRTIQTLGRKQ
ncbi:flagellar basal-body rod protein FlgF [Salipiger mucosus DSM 16094]|uniref:Flagellar basal-body rod protein FlgF n=2 Tax=Salipiger mucosus TaxID=263378 RepID=S9RVM9_9RHOB|nr:flagellar basal-body rod protein FlgF [Salipiger mucosus DSM 16094]